MAIKIDQDVEKYLISAIKRFFSEDLEEDIGDLKAMQAVSQAEGARGGGLGYSAQ